MPGKDTKEEYWQVTRHTVTPGEHHSHLAHSFDSAFAEYCDTIKKADDGERIVLYHVSPDGFVTLLYSTTVG